MSGVNLVIIGHCGEDGASSICHRKNVTTNTELVIGRDDFPLYDQDGIPDRAIGIKALKADNGWAIAAAAIDTNFYVDFKIDESYRKIGPGEAAFVSKGDYMTFPLLGIYVRVVIESEENFDATPSRDLLNEVISIFGKK